MSRNTFRFYPSNPATRRWFFFFLNLSPSFTHLQHKVVRIQMFTSLIKKKKLHRNVVCLKSCWFFVWFFFLGSTTSSSTLHNEAEVGDDDVFTVSTCHLRLFSFMLQFAWSSWKGFSFYASGLASSHLHVWPVGVFYLVEVYPLQKVKPWVSVGLPSPREKHGRADVVRARSELIITLKFPMSWPEWCTHLLIPLFLSLRSFPQTQVGGCYSGAYSRK